RSDSMKKVKKNPNCCSYNSPGFTYSQPFQTDAQIVFDLILSYEHPPNLLCLLISMISLLISLSLTILVDELEQTQLLANIISHW
ncbi:MAG: hypothetical protein IJL85_04390, partial [Erysipelotrichaceae bacterium]|nr:hypothetical protein [Erysipelotrichaceae bacterium]